MVIYQMIIGARDLGLIKQEWSGVERTSCLVDGGSKDRYFSSLVATFNDD